MKQKLIKYYTEIYDISEEKALKTKNNIIELIKHNTDNRIFSFTYPVRGIKGASMLFYNCNIGEVARAFSEDNIVSCYEHNEKLKGFASYVNEKEDASVTWINSDEGLKNSLFNIVVYEEGLDNLKQLEKVSDYIGKDGWLLISGVNDNREFAELLIKKKLRTYFFHVTNFGKIFLLRKG